MSAGLSSKEDVIVCLLVPGYIAVGSDDSADGHNDGGHGTFLVGFPCALLNSAKVKAEPTPDITIFSDGGLSDADDIKGEEWEAAIKSPPKGKKRVTKRQAFTSYYLKDLHFLYKDSNRDDKTKWKGVFRSPFVFQTFAAHLADIKGSQKILSLHDPEKPTPSPIGALGLAAVAVERALTLIATGTLTVEMAHAARGRTITHPRTLNFSTNKDSMRQMGFSDASWGKATHNYAKLAHKLTKAKFNVIVKEAQEFMKPTWTRNKTTDAMEVINVDEDDEWAFLVDNSDSDCK
ncbi:hypothetical protein PILCRDRAFT_738 [Piloderma croceum F 1598]|uniref:Uncharacterized protein n=1 Tax=Piloderma croceum (strain F 1598) TaxID=765440 RepID=A0A0C3GIW9_PILCF|nr:hypothetical protein PILCRDRAFT_738 [Piloderma croceum F 1598]